MKNSRCYKKTSKISIKGIMWHSTGANNPTIKRYIQPDKNDPNYSYLMTTIGKNQYNNDWNTSQASETTHAVIGKLEDGNIATVQFAGYEVKNLLLNNGSLTEAEGLII